MPVLTRSLFTLLASLLVAACSQSETGALDIALIGEADVAAEDEAGNGDATSIAPALRAATAEGLVGLDAQGDVIPALAERWIVTDDGRSYIFRLREGNWPDGSDFTSESVRAALRDALRSLRRTSLGLDLRVVSEVRAMAGRVIEIRLSSPMPDFLQLLAQPELGLRRDGMGAGPMTLESEDGAMVLGLLPPEERGLPPREDWKETTRRLRLHTVPAREAITLFGSNEVAVVLGGGLANLPRAQAGLLSRGTVQLDRVIGLFGMQVLVEKGFLADASRREAVAMAIDREALIAPFNVSGWVPTTRIVAPGLAGDLGSIGERWATLEIEQRQAEAARRVAVWRREEGLQGVTLKIAMPEGPGYDLIFERLETDLRAAGITALRVAAGESADLEIFERLARYAAPSWFLNRFHCSLRRGACSPEADARVAEALEEQDPAAKAALLAEAEAELASANVFIPFGPPLRWSLVRGDVTGFEPNKWGVHPLPPFALIPR